MLGDSEIKVGHGVKQTICSRGTKYIFSKVKNKMQEGDFVFGNLESTLYDAVKNKVPQSRSYRGPPDIIGEIKNTGFNIINVANNHMMQYGEDGFIRTVDLLKRNGINVVGVKKDDCLLLESEGLKIAVLAYSLIDDPYSDNPLYNSGDKNTIIRKIREVKGKSDIVILSLHWGCEHTRHASVDQVRLGRQFVDAGASIILGHHSHVVQGIDHYKAGIIVHSLGNFVFDKHHNKCRESIILTINLTKNKLSTKITPIWIDDDYIPVIMDNIMASNFKKKIKYLSLKIRLEKFDNYKHKMDVFNKRSMAIRKIYRKSLRIYFLKNIYKYSILDIFYFLMPNFVKRSVIKLGRY